MPYVNNKGADQPSVFVFQCLDSMIPLVSISEISRLYLASVAVQAGLCLTLSQTPKSGFLVTMLICQKSPLGINELSQGSVSTI